MEIIWIMIIPIILAPIAFLIWLWEWMKDSQANRWNSTHRYKPDNNGNYEHFYDWDDGSYYSPQPGNSPYPAQFMIQPSGAVRQISKPRSAEEIRVKAYGSYVEGKVESERLEPPEPAPELTNGQNERSQGGFDQLFAQAKAARRGKAEAIEQITGAKKGGGKTYQNFSDQWDSIEL